VYSHPRLVQSGCWLRRQERQLGLGTAGVERLVTIELLFGSFVIFGIGNSWGCCVVDTAVIVVGVGSGGSCYLEFVNIAVDKQGLGRSPKQRRSRSCLTTSSTAPCVAF
jgi:hypothetical protein